MEGRARAVGGQQAISAQHTIQAGTQAGVSLAELVLVPLGVEREVHTSLQDYGTPYSN